MFLLFSGNNLYAYEVQDILQEIKKLKEDNIRLNQRLKKIETAEKTTYSDGKKVIKVNGYIKADALYDLHAKSGDRINYLSIPLDGSVQANNSNHFRMHLKESRIGLFSKRKIQDQLIKLYFEVDFFGDGTESAPGSELVTNSVGLRLRHASINVGSWLIGQSWSNYVDVRSFPENLDFANDTGQSLILQPQIRFTKKISAIIASIAIENPESDFVDFEGNKRPGAKDSLPDFTAKLLYENNKSHYSLQTVLREIKAYRNGSSLSTTGFGIGISGKKFVSSKNIIRFHFSYGDGIGRYIQEASNSAAIVYDSDTVNTLVSQQAYGGYIGFQYQWNNKVRSNINTGFTRINWDDAFNITFENGEVFFSHYQSLHVNLIWRWFEKTDIGVEYSLAKARLYDNRQGKVSRIQMSIKYPF
ncbi:DcaP family trimeric outer membrane transporter [Agarilytica rhodophyticola]|uniref:DcaP family trimeric outer membrane transporter n=1 Tax=Agarilytica rhodophyticola TaxID=1737490 RepID=UPI0013151FCD|nr:DcaP family trimeric outer membrane transporter [Agarilytica rhodophyticola]